MSTSVSPALEAYIDAKEDLSAAIRRGDKATAEFTLACSLYSRLTDGDIEELKRRMKEPKRG